MPTLIQIVSSLPPNIDGVGDFAVTLARALRDRNIETIFIVDPGHQTAASVFGFSVAAPRSRSASELSTLLDAIAGRNETPVLVQYSGYGFDRNGAPEWLVDGLKAYASARSAAVFCYFHELFATPSPWQRGFWYSRSQRRIARELCRLSRQVVTSTQNYGRILTNWRNSQSDEILVLPVFSNAGHPVSPAPACRRRRRLVVFGKEGSRIRVYARWNQFAHAARKLGIEEVVDIGPPVPLPGSAAFHFHAAGPLPFEQIDGLLAESLAGAVVLPSTVLAKSSVFATYAAHGTIPIVSSKSYEPADQLRPEYEYLPVTSPLDRGPEWLDRISGNVHAWYGRHTPNEHGRLMAGLIESTVGMAAV